MLRQEYNFLKNVENGPVKSGPFLYPALTTRHNYTCWLEIDRCRFFSNAYWLKKLIGLNHNIAVVLKSNAYGHGLLEVGSLCEASTFINYMAVFLLSDAIRLRKIGIKKPIVVLGGYDLPLIDGMSHGVDLLVYDWQTADEIFALAGSVKKNVSVQIKVDTGLARLGFSPEEAIAVIDYLVQNPYVSITGMYTHFAESDAQDTSFTFAQIQRMQWVREKVKERNIVIPFIHLANTAATLRFPEARGTMVRCGGALYGSYKDERFYEHAKSILPGFSLKTCLSFKSRVLMIREVPVGIPIGYARTFKTTKPMRLAIVGVGYYDGYDRRLSNTGKMVIHNQVVPIVGRVGMNMTTVDITDIPQVKKGDEVLVIGDHDGIRLKDVARQMDVIEYEVMPPLNPALPRIIV